jgi:hypothetical protein
MTTEQKIMYNNFKKTLELIELSKSLSIAKIMKDYSGINNKEAEIIFWKEVHRIKDISSGIIHNES